jgi:hypothetical protein
MLASAYDDFKHLPPSSLQRFLRMGGKVARFLGPDDGDESPTDEGWRAL